MIDQLSDSRKATEITSHNTKILVIFLCLSVCLCVYLFVLLFFLGIAASSASKMNAKSPSSEQSIFFILTKGTH